MPDLDIRNGHVIAVPDLHSPYHHVRAWNLMLEVIDDSKPKHTVNLGDFADNRPFSRHKKKFGEEKNPPKQDMNLVAREAGRLQKATRGHLTMLLGNHDGWYLNYVAEFAPQLEDFVKSPKENYGLKHEPLAYQRTFRIGKVGYVHDLGHYGVNAIRATLQTAGHNVVFGHAHRGGVGYAGNDAGEQHFSMCCGWLGDRDKITYMPRSATKDWQLGFGDVEYSDGIAVATFVPMIRIGQKLMVRYRGKTYKS